MSQRWAVRPILLFDAVEALERTYVQIALHESRISH